MIEKNRTVTPNKQKGVALLEVLIAILIISFGILGIIGLQANSIAMTSDARYRVDAGALADRVIAEMWVNPGNLNNYAWAGGGTPPAPLAAWVADVQSQLPGATTLPPTVDAVLNGTDYLVTVRVRWQPPSGAAHQHLVFTTINPNPEG